MSASESTTLVGAKFPDEEVGPIDERWRFLNLKDRAAYVRHLIRRDLGEALGTPLFKDEGEPTADDHAAADPLTPEIVKQLLEDALAPAVYVVLSAVKRVATSAQAALVVNDVLRSGAARRELDSFLDAKNGEEAGS